MEPVKQLDYWKNQNFLDNIPGASWYVRSPKPIGYSVSYPDLSEYELMDWDPEWVRRSIRPLPIGFGVLPQSPLYTLWAFEIPDEWDPRPRRKRRR